MLKLRQIEVQRAQELGARLQGGGDLRAELRDEFRRQEIFYRLREAQTVIGLWQNTYNRVRPHSPLDYRSECQAADRQPGWKPKIEDSPFGIPQLSGLTFRNIPAVSMVLSPVPTSDWPATQLLFSSQEKETLRVSNWGD